MAQYNLFYAQNLARIRRLSREEPLGDPINMR